MSMMSISMMLIIFEHHGAPVPIHTNCSRPASQRANKRRIQLRARLRSSEQTLQGTALRRQIHSRCAKKPLDPIREATHHFP